MRLCSLTGTAPSNDTYVAGTVGFSGDRAPYPRLLDDEVLVMNSFSFAEEINPNVW